MPASFAWCSVTMKRSWVAEMRIIAGEYRGRALEAPLGRTTRPTTDRVRESLMSVLTSAIGGFAGLRVYDVFAGSGALGIECLSRGAAFAAFSDSGREAVSCVSANLTKLQVDKSRYIVCRVDVLTRPVVFGLPYDLVLLDPPYALEPSRVRQLLEILDSRGALVPEALISYEHARSRTIEDLLSSPKLKLEPAGSKLYGDTAIDFLRKASQ